MDEDIRLRANTYLDQTPNSRAAKAIRLMLEKGAATTDDLNALGYNHPPRAIGDVKDLGFPVVTTMVRTPAGKRMASYSFGTSADVRAGQIGRTNFSKAFKDRLIARYGSVDAITKAEHPSRLLQIDHRVPYRIGGDAGLVTDDVEAFMLLDAKSQRAKSWSCEQCLNFRELQDSIICRGCFWAFPESYEHVAMRQERRVDLLWQGAETADHDALAKRADAAGVSLNDFLKMLGRQEIVK